MTCHDTQRLTVHDIAPTNGTIQSTLKNNLLLVGPAALELRPRNRLHLGAHIDKALVRPVVAGRHKRRVRRDKNACATFSQRDVDPAQFVAKADRGGARIEKAPPVRPDRGYKGRLEEGCLGQ